MPNDDPMLNPSAGVATPAAQTPPVMPEQKPTKEPGKFERIFSGILGGAVSVATGGTNGVFGRLVGRVAPDFGSFYELMQQQQSNSMQMIGLQQSVGTQNIEFSTISNLLKSRHDSEMTAVQNYKG